MGCACSAQTVENEDKPQRGVEYAAETKTRDVLYPEWTDSPTLSRDFGFLNRSIRAASKGPLEIEHEQLRLARQQSMAEEIARCYRGIREYGFFKFTPEIQAVILSMVVFKEQVCPKAVKTLGAADGTASTGPIRLGSNRRSNTESYGCVLGRLATSYPAMFVRIEYHPNWTATRQRTRTEKALKKVTARRSLRGSKGTVSLWRSMAEEPSDSESEDWSDSSNLSPYGDLWRHGDSDRCNACHLGWETKASLYQTACRKCNGTGRVRRPIHDDVIDRKSVV